MVVEPLQEDGGEELARAIAVNDEHDPFFPLDPLRTGVVGHFFLPGTRPDKPRKAGQPEPESESLDREGAGEFDSLAAKSVSFVCVRYFL
jgi:hypothetical protein